MHDNRGDVLDRRETDMIGAALGLKPYEIRRMQKIDAQPKPRSAQDLLDGK
jgi:hypothetical protein